MDYRQSLKKDVHITESHEKSQEKADLHDEQYKTRRQVIGGACMGEGHVQGRSSWRGGACGWIYEGEGPGRGS